MNLNKEKYYLIGIGGIGMSSLAEYLISLGNEVSGCDKIIDTDLIRSLINKNIEVKDENNCYEQIIKFNPNKIISTNNVPFDHPVLKYANDKSIKILNRLEILSYFTNSKKIIGVTGSHGKTSTSGMISYIFRNTNMSPTSFIGGIMSQINTNFEIGDSDYIVIEACEAYREFLHLTPDISIITNISLEHLETYKDMDDIENTYLNYVNNTKKDGNIIINTDDFFMQNWVKKLNRKFYTYGINKNNQNFAADNIELKDFYSKYDLFFNNKKIAEVKINIPGIHQIKNSVAAIATAFLYGIDIDKIVSVFENYKGVERRFQLVGNLNKCPVYDDYGHHPKEIENMLEVLKNSFLGKRIIFFQPHKYTRTKFLWNEFIDVFYRYADSIDTLYLTDVYPAGDPFDEIYNSENLQKELVLKNINCKYIKFDHDFENLIKEVNYFKYSLNLNDVILCLGAGVLDKLAKKISSIN